MKFLKNKIIVGISFFLTFLKLVFLPVGIIQIMSGSKWITLTISLLILLDIWDGKILRLSFVSITGSIIVKRQILDIIIDRILLHTLLFLSIREFNLNILFYFIVFIRELFLGYIVLKNWKCRKLLIKPNWFSKGANISIGFFVALLIWSIKTSFVFYGLFLILSIYSIFLYLKKPRFF